MSKDELVILRLRDLRTAEAAFAIAEVDTGDQRALTPQGSAMAMPSDSRAGWCRTGRPSFHLPIPRAPRA
jgi:hypothetical protein